MYFLNTILDIFLPPKCVSCGKNGLDLCLECLSEARGAERESAEWIFPIYDYRDPSIKKALWVLKYKGKKRLGRVFAEIIYEKILEELSDLSTLENFTEPIIIPIPLSRERYRERGFNQAEIICRELEKISAERGGPQLKMEGAILIKPRETTHQAHIKDRGERLKNVIGSFSVKDPDILKNKNIILIDDITTTGATLGEARKVLRAAGARKVIAFTVAH